VSALVRIAALLAWRDLPRLMLVTLPWIASIAPLAIATLTGQAWLVVLAGFPLALLTTGLAHSGAVVLRGERLRFADAFRVDAVLAIALLAGFGAAGFALATGGAFFIAGAVLAAVVLFIGPLALSYGAVRGRSGFSAIRGGAILAMVRPGWALSLLSLGVLGSFAIAASLGVLALAVPGILAVIGTSAVAHLLEALGMPAGPADNRLTPDRRHTPGRHPESRLGASS
jgi:hypothetical protein